MDQKELIQFGTNFLLGGVSGALSKTVTSPIEVVKLKLQTQENNKQVLTGEVKKLNGIADGFKRTLAKQGVRGFWAGNLTNIYRYFPTQAFNLAFKDTIKKAFPKVDKQEEFLKFFFVQLASGGVAGGATLSIVYPLDFARTRLASDLGEKKQFKGLRDCLAQTYRKTGFFSIYNGYAVSVAGAVVYRGAQFGLFDTIVSFNPLKDSTSPLALFSKFATAQVAVSVSGLVAYPFDTIRRQMQMESELPAAQRKFSSGFSCLRIIFKEKGVSGFYRGALANIFRGVGASLVLLIYGEAQNAVARLSSKQS